MQEEQKQISSHTALIFIGVLVLLVISILVPGRFFGVREVKKEEPLDLTQFQTSEAFSKSVDKNSDGSVSWQELLGDSFSSSVNKDEKADPKILAISNDPNNLTASFAKNLAVSSVYVRDNKIEDEETQQAILQNIIDEESSKISSKKYFYNDLSFAPDDSKETIKIYGNALADALSTIATKKTFETNYTSLEYFAQTNKKEYLDEIKKESIRVAKILQRLQSMHIPPSASTYHLIVLNQVSAYQDSLANMAKSDDDPVRGALGSKTFSTNFANVVLLHKKMNEYFSLKNVIFSSGEKGYVFTIGYKL